MVLEMGWKHKRHCTKRDRFSSCDYLWKRAQLLQYSAREKKNTGMKHHNYPEPQKGHSGKLLLHFLVIRF